MTQLAKSSEELMAERQEVLEAAERFNEEHADPATGVLSADDQSAFESMLKRARSLADESKRAYMSENQVPPAGNLTVVGGGENVGRLFGNSRRPAEFVNTVTGEPLVALEFGDSIGAASHHSRGDDDRPGVGATIHSLITGEGGNMATNISSSDTAGGYLANPKFSADVLDLARSASVAMRFGARTVPMTSGELHMARLTQDVTGYWRREGTRITSSDTAFDRITLRPKVLAAITPITIELAEDAGNIQSVIEGSMSSALGLALDQAILFGVGSEAEPQGITNTTGVNTETSVGTPDDYAEVTSSVRQILTANYSDDVSKLAWLAHPRSFATYDGLTDTTGQPLMPTPWASKLRQGSTTSFSVTEGGGSNESSMIIGDLSQVVVGMRTSGVRIEVFREGVLSDGSTETDNAVHEMKIIIRAYLRADVAVLRPAFLTVLSGVTAS